MSTTPAYKFPTTVFALEVNSKSTGEPVDPKGACSFCLRPAVLIEVLFCFQSWLWDCPTRPSLSPPQLILSRSAGSCRASWGDPRQCACGFSDRIFNLNFPSACNLTMD